MEVFPLELQILIAKKIAASSVRDLISFRASAKLHQRLSEDVEVLRAVFDDCLHLIFLPSPNAGQRRLMQQLTLGGHAHYCVDRAAQLLPRARPKLQMIQLVLRNALLARSDETVYFLLMLRVLSTRVFDRNRALSVFRDLFVRQCLAHCRNVISACDLFSWDQLAFGLRLVPPGLVHRFTCLANGACAQSNRFHNLHLPSPGADNDYDMDTIYLFCRLDVEIAWFLEHFCFFFYLDFFL